MRAALVVNAYDAGNWGDAAIVEGLISSLRAVGFDHIAVAPVDWVHAHGLDKTVGRAMAYLFNGAVQHKTANEASDLVSNRGNSQAAALKVVIEQNAPLELLPCDAIIGEGSIPAG